MINIPTTKWMDLVKLEKESGKKNKILAIEVKRRKNVVLEMTGMKSHGD